MESVNLEQIKSTNFAPEKRRYLRAPSDKIFRIYTSLTAVKQTVRVSDISDGGVFIKTKHLPKVGETISFVVLDSYGMEQGFENGRVTWIKMTGPTDGYGFGVETEPGLLNRIKLATTIH